MKFGLVFLLLIFSLTSFANGISTTVKSGEREFILKVMNYNVKGLPLPWLTHKKRYQRIGNALKAMIERGEGPHIVSLQEAVHKKTAMIGDITGYPYRAKGPLGKGLRANGGVETLSVFPITKQNVLVYDKCVSYDCLARKGVLHTEITIPNLPIKIDLFSTHMQAGPTGDPFISVKKTKQIREYQGMKYIEFATKYADPNNIQLHIGDFNFRQSEDMYNWFTKLQGLQDSIYNCGIWKDCDGIKDPMATWEALIDHQFYKVSPRTNVTIRPIFFERYLENPKKKLKYSDHKAVMVYYHISW